MRIGDLEEMKKEFFKKGGKVIILPPNTYAAGIKKFSHFPQHSSHTRKPLTSGRGQGVSQANIVYSGNPEG